LTDEEQQYKEFVTTRTTVKTIQTTSFRQLGPLFDENLDQYSR